MSSLAIRFTRACVRFFLLRCPTLRGGVRVAQSGFCQQLARKNQITSTRLWRGPKIEIQLNDYDGRSIYFWGANDRKIAWLCSRLLRAGDTMLDIGANFGAVGLVAAARVGRTGQVHCFEPQPGLAQAIRASARINGFSQVFVHELALSDRDGTMDLHVPNNHSGRASLAEISETGTTLRVPVRPAGPYLSRLGLGQVRLLKLDVEFHEETVLENAFGFLEGARPLAIIFECHENHQPFFSRASIKMLRALNFDLFQIRQKPLFRVQLRRIKREEEVETGYDFVACDAARVESDLVPVCSVI